MTEAPTLFLRAPRSRVPSAGPAGVAKASESDVDDDVIDELTLHEPDGALGVLRNHPPPDGCVLTDCPDADLSTTSGYFPLADEGVPDVEPVSEDVEE